MTVVAIMLIAWNLRNSSSIWRKFQKEIWKQIEKEIKGALEEEKCGELTCESGSNYAYSLEFEKFKQNMEEISKRNMETN